MTKIILSGALAAMVCCPSVFAQIQNAPGQGTNQDPAKNRMEYQSNFRGPTAAGKAMIHRTSEILGMDVQSPKNESIGEVNDLVIDAQSGKVRYAAVSVGGFLGIGDKLIAVPWNAFQCKADEDGDAYLSLNTTKEKLEAAPGFNQDNWPDFADQKWSTENDRHYELDLRVGSNRSNR